MSVSEERMTPSNRLSWLLVVLARKVNQLVASIHLFPLFLWNRPPLNSSFCMCTGHDPSSPESESQCQGEGLLLLRTTTAPGLCPGPPR